MLVKSDMEEPSGAKKKLKTVSFVYFSMDPRNLFPGRVAVLFCDIEPINFPFCVATA